MNSWSDDFRAYKAETVEEEIGLEEGTVKKIATELRANRGRALVVGGSIQFPNQRRSGSAACD